LLVKIGFKLPDAEEAVMGDTRDEGGISQALGKHLEQVFRLARSS
jgi:hypothetical protein